MMLVIRTMIIVITAIAQVIILYTIRKRMFDKSVGILILCVI